MTKHGRIHITEEKKAYIEQHWGPIESLGDDDAKEIVEEIIADPIIEAEFEDDETIRYAYKAWDEDDYDDEPYPAFTEEYLNHIGMSMRDFI